MANKRFIPRVRKRLKVLLNGVQSFTSDVSPGGFCVELLEVLPVGSDVSGALKLGEIEVQFSGKVQWAAAGERRILKRARMGIRFTGIDPSFYQHYLENIGRSPA